MITSSNGVAEPKEKSSKTYSKLGYSKLETAALVDAMNKLLANYNMHYQKLRNFHWNVKGPDFFDVHEQFELQYNGAKVAIDDIAERIRVFGQTPLSNFSDYLEASTIRECKTNMTAMEMVHEIINDYKILLEQMFKVVEVALEYGDSGTEDMVKSFIKTTEKNHWMMTAFSHKE